MITGIVDTNILIHMLRKNSAAVEWFASSERLAIVPFVWLEVMYGAQTKVSQASTRILLRQFDMLYPTAADMEWAMEMLLSHRFTLGADEMDYLIASVCARLQLPLYTHNLKDFVPLLGATLVVKPYTT